MANGYHTRIEVEPGGAKVRAVISLGVKQKATRGSEEISDVFDLGLKDHWWCYLKTNY